MTCFEIMVVCLGRKKREEEALGLIFALKTELAARAGRRPSLKIL
jgi:hypothetical protein